MKQGGFLGPPIHKGRKAAGILNHYEVFDKVTGEVKGRRKTRTGARKLADKLDLEYGCIRYGVREVY